MFLFRDLGSLLCDSSEDGVCTFNIGVGVGDSGLVANESCFRLKGVYLLLEAFPIFFARITDQNERFVVWPGSIPELVSDVLDEFSDSFDGAVLINLGRGGKEAVIGCEIDHMVHLAHTLIWKSAFIEVLRE